MRTNASVKAGLLEFFVRAVDLIVVQAESHQQRLQTEDRAQRSYDRNGSPSAQEQEEEIEEVFNPRRLAETPFSNQTPEVV